jgi:hypothetical protein
MGAVLTKKEKIATKCDFDLKFPINYEETFDQIEDQQTVANKLKSAKEISDIADKKYIREFVQSINDTKKMPIDGINFDAVKDINVLNNEISIIKNIVTHIPEMGKVLSLINQLMMLKYDFYAPINKNWQEIGFEKHGYQFINSLISKNIKFDNLSYLQLFWRLYTKYTLPVKDIMLYDENSRIKAIKKLMKNLPIDTKFLKKVIDSIEDKSQIKETISYLNIHTIINKESADYSGFSDEDFCTAIISGKCDIVRIKKIIEHITEIDIRARNYIIEKDYTLLNYDKPNFSDKWILHEFAKRNNIAMVKRLCAKGCDLDEKDINGHTPTMIANKNGYIDIVQIINAYRIIEAIGVIGAVSAQVTPQPVL